jgi:hypothetical protein
MLRKDLSNCLEVRHVEQRHSAHVKQSHCAGKQSRLPTVRIYVELKSKLFLMTCWVPQLMRNFAAVVVVKIPDFE